MSDQADDPNPLAEESRALRQRVAEPSGHDAAAATPWDVADALAEPAVRAALDLLADGLWECNFSTRELSISPRWLAALGYRSEDLSRDLSVLRELFHPDDQARLMAAMTAHLSGESQIYEVECRIRAKSGEWRWIASRGCVVERDEAGRVVRMFGVNHDISARAAAEQALRESEEKFAKAFDANPNSVVLSRVSDGVILECNRSALRMGNYSREDLIGHSIEELGLYADPSDREEVVRELRETGELSEREVEIRRPDGSLGIYTISAQTIEVAGETCVVTVGRDVTGQRELEEQLRQSQKMEAVGQLAGGIAHDFNNLLVVISGYGETLLEKLEPGSELSEAAREIMRASSRAASLTHQLLAFGRRQSLQARVLDLNEIVRDMDRMLRRLIGEEIALSMKLEPLLGRVKADPGQIQQMLLNLAVNARDAMPSGGPLRISTRNVPRAQARSIRGVELTDVPHVCVSVSDSGVGIPEDVQDQIFEPFFTTKNPGQGTGLGLSTVYGIAKQSGGDIRVESRPGYGSTFEIFLPVVSEKVAAARPVPAEARRGEFAGRTILVVEDEASVRKLVRLILERSGFRVLAAANGREALTLAGSHEGPIDLALTDVRMPRMGGLEMSQALQKAHPETRVIFMSGYASPSASDQDLLRSANDFLLKPFGPAELLAKVREVLADEP